MVNQPSVDKEVRQELIELGIKERDLYDQTPDLEDLYKIPVASGLSDAELEEAYKLRRFFYGVMMVTGKPGSGKGLFVNTLLYKMKKYFGRRILLDYKPKALFGPYLPFNEEMIIGELTRMTAVAATPLSQKPEEIPTTIRRNNKVKLSELLDLAEKWVSEKGQVYLKGGALGLDELKRYLHNRRPHNPMGITIGHIVTIHRHLDLLLIGMAPFEQEIDAISFLPYVTHEVRCSWIPPGKAQCNIYQTRWASNKGILELERRPYTLTIDGEKPRSELGGKRLYDLYNSKDPKVMSPVRQVLKM